MTMHKNHSVSNLLKPNFSTQNIVLTGFMGTGKSTIGQRLAQRLGRDFVDMDAQLEAHFGKPIAAVFAEEGEPAFRLAEIRLCQQLAQQQSLVIATGGGALVNPSSRHELAQSGVLICLTASIDEILRRLEQFADRPLLDGTLAERQQRVRDLLHERRQAYAAIPHQVDTTGRTPEQIVERILDVVAGDAEVRGMTRIPVQHPAGSYDICLGEGLLAHAGDLLRARDLRPGTVAVVSNQEVAAHHGEILLDSLRSAGYEPTLCLVPEGEQHKTLATVASLYDQFLDAGLDRSSAVLSLGGGVVGDMAGFAAASFLRGVPYVQMPTSLLSMVDASVGGKTGVDLPQGKNLVGAFKQPEVVIIDTATLSTLPSAEFRAGLAEIIKHGLIGAPDLFAQLEEYGPTCMAHLVADAVRVKVEVVEEDPFEQGRRATLNLGHTFGHAIEHVSGYRVRHGEGVALGLVAAAHMAHAIGRCDASLVERTRNVVDRMGLPTCVGGYDLDLNIDEVMQAMWHDKKRRGKTLRFLIAQDVGDVVVIDNPGESFVRDALSQVLE